MAQYIEKSVLVAEIERLKDELKASDYAAYKEAYIIGAEHTIKTISDVIDTLEVKEVDLEKEITNYISGNFFGSQTMGFFSNRTKEEPNDQDIALCAKNFFELGMQVSNKAQKGE